MNDTRTEPQRSGFVAIVGRPNVGKSSLVNRMVGSKVSIISRRPQTTRNRILGVSTRGATQIVFVDTPGIHGGQTRELNRIINRTAEGSMEGVDLVLMLVAANRWTDDDDLVYRKARESGLPVILGVNKVDLLEKRDDLLPYLARVAAEFDFDEVVPLSVRKGYNVDHLFEVLAARLPEMPHGFPDDQVTDRGRRFQAAELVREKMFWHLGQELPYSSAVEVTRMDEDEQGMLRIEATIWVEKPGQKAIVIGRNGAALKTIGCKARVEMERQFGCKVYLGLWVKVRKGWTENAGMLRSLGLSEW